MRKLLTCTFSTLILILLSNGLASAQTRSVFWQQWDVHIDNIDAVSNRFNVSETHVVNFSGTFQFGSRVIAMTNLQALENIRVLENGQPLQFGCSQTRGTFCAQNNGDSLALTYYFRQPISNRVQTFEIAYTVVGALRIYDAGDQLWWIGIPQDHFGFPIASSEFTVQMPSGFSPREGIDPIETYGAPGDIRVQGQTITAKTTRQISANEALEIRVQFPHNESATPPPWQSNFDSRRDFEENVQPLIDLVAIAIGLAILLGGPLGIYVIWYIRGRDPKIGPIPEYLTTPPSNLPPAVAGTLVDERADLRDVLSTLIHLAHRGYLVMEEQQTEGIIFGIGKSSEFVFKRTDKALDDLRPFEKDIVRKVFGARGLEKSLASLKNSFYRYVPKLQKQLYSELVREGFFAAEPDSTRQKWRGLGGVIMVLSFIALIAAASVIEEYSASLLFVPAAFAVTGLLAVLVGSHMPAKTSRGAEEAAKWNAFREYLKNLEKYEEVESAANKFDMYLAYAVAFGLDRTWIRRFSRSQNARIPFWYFPTHLGGPYRRGYTAGTPVADFAGGSIGSAGELVRANDGGLSLDSMSGSIVSGLESISDGLTDMLDSAARVMTSRPQQSSGSGRWSSGGSSWSGGGFSGGGGSGGGSAGFG